MRAANFGVEYAPKCAQWPIVQGFTRPEVYFTKRVNGATETKNIPWAQREVFAAQNPDVELVQLVSFGCGVDAVTTDEVRSILEGGGKIYTQIKIDEITNLGAVKIRLRSLFAAVAQQKGGR